MLIIRSLIVTALPTVGRTGLDLAGWVTVVNMIIYFAQDIVAQPLCI